MNDSSETQTFSNREWRIIGVTSVGHGLCHVSELSFAAVIGAVMAEYGLTPDQAAALAVPGFVLYGVLAIPAGLWTDRRGAREVLRGYFALVTLAALVVCFAQTAWHLAAALTLLGAAISLYHPAGLTMVAQGCRRRGRAMGLNGVAGSLGVALGPALGLFFASRGNWRATYGVIALCGGIGALTTRWLPADDDPHPSLGHAVAAENGQAGPRWRVLGLLFAAMLLGGINYRALTTALPTFLSDQANAAAPVEANPTPAPTGQKTRTRSGGTVVFVVLALGGVGQLVGGHLADRFRPQSVYVIAILLTVPCARDGSRSSVLGQSGRRDFGDLHVCRAAVGEYHDRRGDAASLAKHCLRFQVHSHLRARVQWSVLDGLDLEAARPGDRVRCVRGDCRGDAGDCRNIRHPHSSATPIRADTLASPRPPERSGLRDDNHCHA